MDPLDLILNMEDEQIIPWLVQLASTQPEPTRNQNRERAIILHDQIAGHKRLMKDYFVKFPVYNNQIFERCFCMSRNLFDWLCQDLQVHHWFWEIKAVCVLFPIPISFPMSKMLTSMIWSQDCCGQIGLLPQQKITSVLRQLTYGTSADSTDEYVQIGKTIALQTLKYFTRHVVEI
jgi:hypothetical protein